jgi:hypothetical protein
MPINQSSIDVLKEKLAKNHLWQYFRVITLK